MKYIIPIALFGIILFFSSAFDRKKEEIKFIVPSGWPQPAYDFSKNKLTQAGFELGRRLFYDPILSTDGSVSCASCHAILSAFTQPVTARPKGKRNSLPLFNLAWNTSFMWDGGVNNLEVQPLAPITSHSEMNNTLASVVAALDTIHGYRLLFYKAFADSTITGQHVLKALAQFLVAPESFNSKYDRYTHHEAALTTQELHGFSLFRQHCAGCHAEPLFTNYSFQNIGLPVDLTLKDYGRMTITQNIEDSLKFKVPSLRNVAVTSPYMHDGRFKTLPEVLDHYTDGIMESPTLVPELRKSITLSPQDKNDVIAFLHTLTDSLLIKDVKFIPCN